MSSFISIKHKGNFNNTEKFFKRVLRRDWLHILERYGQDGVNVLQAATPKDTGETADSWTYEIDKGRDGITISWSNNNKNEGVSVVILLIYGHGLWNGGYVEGNDFVTPAIRPVLQEMADRAWKEVTR